MRNIIFSNLFLFILAFFNPANATSLFPKALINAEWLSEHIDDVIILDTRKDLESFTKNGHIENAILVDVTKIREDRIIDGKKLTRMRPEPKSFEKFMRDHGINNDSQIVITHQGKTPGQVAGAARLYWQMKYYGVANVALLDGGNAAWVAALEDLSNEKSTPPQKGDYTVGNEHPEILATMQQVRQALKDKTTSLLDTRNLRYHIGVDKKDYVFEYGHIPGSKLFPYKFLNPAHGTTVYFPAKKIKEIIHNLNINENNQSIMYCNSAYECSSIWFVLHELLGKKARVYDGSLHQWTQYPENPMATELDK